MLTILLAGQMLSSKDILKDSWTKVYEANSLTMTVVSSFEEVGHENRIRYAYRKGGFFRADTGTIVDVGTSKGGWTFSTTQKKYQIRPGMPKDFNIAQSSDLSAFQGALPTKGNPVSVTWHKRKALKIELDGTSMTKETKLFVFVDPQSHLPVGVSANLGSVTQVRLFEELKLNQTIPDALFRFTPPAGWKKVTSSTGGWK